jgi:hypothetical protein
MAQRDLKTYSIKSPPATHWRSATCEEVGCIPFHTGWRLRIDVLSEADQHAVKGSGRHYSECVIDVDPDSGEVYTPPAVFYIFEAGQPCFKASTHRAPTGRPELYVVRERGEVRRYDRGDQWADDCATHTTKIVDKIKEG